jgi:hypothetical protein
MNKKTTLSKAHRQLVYRYLLWGYKTTKESFERIERKTTQLIVDQYILESLQAQGKTLGVLKDEYDVLVDDFKTYIKTKQADELKLKFSNTRGKIPHPQYVYLKNRLEAIEAAIRYFLGHKELRVIQELYEKEFTQRILQAREH